MHNKLIPRDLTLEQLWHYSLSMEIFFCRKLPLEAVEFADRNLQVESDLMKEIERLKNIY